MVESLLPKLLAKNLELVLSTLIKSSICQFVQNSFLYGLACQIESKRISIFYNELAFIFCTLKWGKFATIRSIESGFYGPFLIALKWVFIEFKYMYKLIFQVFSIFQGFGQQFGQMNLGMISYWAASWAPFAVLET